jgi:predicted nuclease with TOPRIM domain
MDVLYFEACISQKERLDKALNEASEALNKYPKGNMGLTPDHVKFSEEYRKDKSKFNKLFKAVQSINRYLNKHHKKQFREYQEKNRFKKVNK